MRKSIILAAFLAGVVVGYYVSRHTDIPFVSIEDGPWSIGILDGTSLVEFEDSKISINPVLTAEDVTDVNAKFVADPFMLHKQGRWYMFFEVLNSEIDQGDIGLASSLDGRQWQYEKIVLNEPFHLSFPYVFEAEGNIYLIPESHQAEAVRLYKAKNFPFEWSFVGNLLEGSAYTDNAVFKHEGRWWLLNTKKNEGSKSLHLYFADSLLGPWTTHPKSPVVRQDGNIARMGGRVLSVDDRIIRYTQDTDPVYGKEVRAFEITILTEAEYQEKQIGPDPVIGPTGKGWNAQNMHHIDPHKLSDKKWIAVVDGKGRKRLRISFDY